jgi:hypothetical protein
MVSAGRVLMTVRPSGVLHDALVGELGQDGLVRDGGATGPYHILDGGWSRTEGQSPTLHVRAREVQLDGGDAVVTRDSLAEGGELGDGISGHGNEEGDSEIEGVQVP